MSYTNVSLGRTVLRQVSNMYLHPLMYFCNLQVHRYKVECRKLPVKHTKTRHINTETQINDNTQIYQLL